MICAFGVVRSFATQTHIVLIFEDIEFAVTVKLQGPVTPAVKLPMITVGPVWLMLIFVALHPLPVGAVHGGDVTVVAGEHENVPPLYVPPG